MANFVQSLTEAHAVFVSYMMGDDTCAAICRRTRLPVPTVREWLRLLNLRVRENNEDSKEARDGFVLNLSS